MNKYVIIDKSNPANPFIIIDEINGLAILFESYELAEEYANDLNETQIVEIY